MLSRKPAFGTAGGTYAKRPKLRAPSRNRKPLYRNLTETSALKSRRGTARMVDQGKLPRPAMFGLGQELHGRGYIGLNYSAYHLLINYSCTWMKSTNRSLDRATSQDMYVGIRLYPYIRAWTCKAIASRLVCVDVSIFKKFPHHIYIYRYR